MKSLVEIEYIVSVFKVRRKMNYSIHLNACTNIQKSVTDTEILVGAFGCGIYSLQARSPTRKNSQPPGGGFQAESLALGEINWAEHTPPRNVNDDRIAPLLAHLHLNIVFVLP